MEIPSSGVYLLIAAICFAVTVQVALASGRLRVTLIRYEFLYYGRQPTRTSTLAATQPTVAAPSSTESVSPPPSDVISDVATDTPRDAGDVRGPLHRETDSEEPSTTQELSFPWQQETVCNTTSPPRPRYRFLLCVDYSDPGVPNPSPCQLGRLETDALPARAFGEGRDVVTFPLVLSSTSSGQLRLNPETVAFNHWPGTLRVSVFVTCCGVSHDYTGQCQETLTHIIAGEPAPSGTQSQPRTVLLQGHGRLMLRMVLECDEGFYGPACNVPCGVDTPGIEHAVCNVTTGQKECMAGWEGPGCQTDTDECRLSLCHNGAVCVNSPPGSFTCKCPLGTGGRLCESRVQVCHLRPCLNGATCLDSAFGFVCFCRPGFSGYQCETVLATQGGSDIMPVHNVGQPLPVSSIQHDGSLLVGGGGNTEAQSQEQVSTWHAWYIVLIVIAFIVITSLAVIGCVIIKGRKEYKISGRRPLYSFRWTARVLKRTVRRKRKTQLRDEGGDEDQRPYIVHLHRTDNSPGDDGEEDKYPNIVHLHRQQTINTNDSDKDLPGVARWLDDAKPRSDLDPLSGSSESARQRHVTMINQPSCRIRSMEVGVQEYCLQDDENDDGHYEDFVLENRDYGRKTEPCPHAFDEADGCCVFDNFNDNYLDAAFDDRFKQVYTIGGTMTLEELHVKSFKTRNPKRTARTLESLSTSSPAAATATTASFLPDVEAVQGSRVQARRVRRVDSAGYEVPQLIRPLADVRRSEGGYASLDDYHHLVTMPRDLVNDAGSDTASLLELGVCTAVPPPRDER